MSEVLAKCECGVVIIGPTFAVMALVIVHGSGTKHDVVIESKEGTDGIRLERAQRTAG